MPESTLLEGTKQPAMPPFIADAAHPEGTIAGSARETRLGGDAPRASRTIKIIALVALSVILGALAVLALHGNSLPCRSIDIAQSVALAGCSKPPAG